MGVLEIKAPLLVASRSKEYRQHGMLLPDGQPTCV